MTEPRRYDVLDRALDAALAKYASAEPRPGLEGRILANLRAHAPGLTHQWWKWGLAGAMAVILIIAAIVWRIRELPHHPTMANQSTGTTPAPSAPEERFASHGPGPRPRPARRRKIPRQVPPDNAALAVAENPKLDQFPSPQPLTEQEQILLNYVARQPERAALIAEARMRALQKDHEEELRETNLDIYQGPESR